MTNATFRAISVIALVLFSTYGYSQMPMDETTNRYTYQEVIEVSGATKEELFDKARMWFTVTYVDAKSVIEVEDKAEGKIIGKGSFLIPFSLADRAIQHVVTLEVKNGRYRYTFTNFYLDMLTSSIGNCTFEDMPKMNRKNIYGKTHEKMMRFSASLKKAMSAPLATQRDW
jgi:hypothetical protein